MKRIIFTAVLIIISTFCFGKTIFWICPKSKCKIDVEYLLSTDGKDYDNTVSLKSIHTEYMKNVYTENNIKKGNLSEIQNFIDDIINLYEGNNKGTHYIGENAIYLGGKIPKTYILIFDPTGFYSLKLKIKDLLVIKNKISEIIEEARWSIL